MSDNMSPYGGSPVGGKIVFFGTSNVALPILESLKTKHEVLAVVTQPDAKSGRKQEFSESPVSVLAKEMDLKVLKPKKVSRNDIFRVELEALGADIFIVVSYGKILPSNIINMPKYKTVNIHFSILPKYRGPSPIQTALLNGDKETGTSIFILDEKVDHGPILAQEKAQIDPGDNYFTLSEKLAFKSSLLINQTIEDYTSGVLKPIPQDDSQATHTKIITKQDGAIDWEISAIQIYNKFKAFYPWPGIWTKWNGKMVKILDCYPSAISFTNAKPGTVLDGSAVVCGSGSTLEIKTLQLEGKNETDILSFLNGYKDFVGSKLG